MNAKHNAPGTNYLADQWLAQYNRMTAHLTDKKQAETLLNATLASFNCTAHGPIVHGGEVKGHRYLFPDTSFADFYFEAQEKGAVFTGFGGHADMINQSHFH